MRSVAGVLVLCLALALALLATSVRAVAAPKTITGKLSKPGYTVIALANDGRGKTVRASRGRFRLRAPAKRATLHLRAPNGKYAGPIVIDSRNRGRRTIVGVKSGARLGKIKIRRGYGTVTKSLRQRWVDRKRWARARKGAPIGSRVFGRVRSRPPGSREQPQRPEDMDVDGVPNVLDIDDDGDLVLDDFDPRPLCHGCTERRRVRPGSARAAQEEQDPQVTDKLRVTSFLELGIEQSVNVNAPGLDPERITELVAAPLRSHGRLGLQISDRPLPAGAELNCAEPQLRTEPTLKGLVYCSSGGTGKVSSGCLPPASECPFPGPRGSAPFDTDGDGFGTVTADPGGCPPAIQGCQPFMTLRHGASPDEIGTGDYLILHASDHDRSAVLQYAFATTPALNFYNDGQGNSAPVSYPVAAPTPGPPPTPGGLGTRGNGLPVSAPPGQEVKVTLTFWRPQRRPTSEAECVQPQPGCTREEWIDVGGLIHRANAESAGGTPPVECPQSSYENHPGLTVPGGERTAGLIDDAPNRPASPANTLTYALNLTACLRSNNRESSFDQPAEEVGFSFGARALNSRDIAIQRVYFKRQ